MAYAERSAADVALLVKNAAPYSQTVRTAEKIPLLPPDELEKMLAGTSQIDVFSIGRSAKPT